MLAMNTTTLCALLPSVAPLMSDAVGGSLWGELRILRPNVAVSMGPTCAADNTRTMNALVGVYMGHASGHDTEYADVVRIAVGRRFPSVSSWIALRDVPTEASTVPKLFVVLGGGDAEKGYKLLRSCEGDGDAVSDETRLFALLASRRVEVLVGISAGAMLLGKGYLGIVPYTPYANETTGASDDKELAFGPAGSGRLVVVANQ
jgi:hypothetical protein